MRSIRVSHFNAPLIILVCYDKETAWRNPADIWYDNYCSGEQDATIVAATMMYEAEELGIHNVWLMGFDSKAVAETFDLPKNHIPVMMFAMRYPSEKTKPSDWHFVRKPIEETVTVL